MTIEKQETKINLMGSDPTMLQEIIEDRVIREREATPNEILMYRAGFSHLLKFDAIFE